MRRSSSISIFATSDSALAMPARATSRSYSHEPAFSRSRSAWDRSRLARAAASASRLAINSCSVVTFLANVSSLRRSASVSRTTADWASFTCAMRTGIFSLRGSASSRRSSLLDCDTAARFTASSPCSSRSSSLKSGVAGSTASPTVTNTCTTTPGVAEPTAMFSVCASTTPAAASVAANGLRAGAMGGGGSRAITRVFQTYQPAKPKSPRASSGSPNWVR